MNEHADDQSSNRRDFYRIQDRVYLRYQTLHESQLGLDPYHPAFAIPPELILASELHKPDGEMQTLLHAINDSSRNVASYLKLLNQKVDTLTRAVLAQAHNARLEADFSVNLSEGGLSFYSNEEFPLRSSLHLVMMFFPAYTAIAAICKVTSSEKMNTSTTVQFRTGVEFAIMSELDRHRVARHIIQRQAEARRAAQSRKEQDSSAGTS
jgi:hypothetical protein